MADYGFNYRNLSPCIRAWCAELRRRGLTSRFRIEGIATTKAQQGKWPRRNR